MENTGSQDVLSAAKRIGRDTDIPYTAYTENAGGIRADHAFIRLEFNLSRFQIEGLFCAALDTGAASIAAVEVYYHGPFIVVIVLIVERLHLHTLLPHRFLLPHPP